MVMTRRMVAFPPKRYQSRSEPRKKLSLLGGELLC
jgi:hypothetical protein